MIQHQIVKNMTINETKHKNMGLHDIIIKMMGTLLTVSSSRKSVDPDNFWQWQYIIPIEDAHGT